MALSRLANSARILSLHDLYARTLLLVFSIEMPVESTALAVAFVSGCVVGQWVLEYLSDLIFLRWIIKVLSATNWLMQITKDVSIIHFHTLERFDLA